MARDELRHNDAAPAPSDVSPPAEGTSLRRLTMILFAGLALAAIFSYWLKSHGFREPRGGLTVGSPMPELRAFGWVNGSAPNPADLRGKVVVVNAWFTTCKNCHEQAPEIVALHNRFHERGVVFVGLTYEPPEMLEYIKYTLDKLNMTWTNGYGALDTLRNFDAAYFPSYWVIGRDGRVAWNTDSRNSLDEAIEEALAEKTETAGR